VHHGTIRAEPGGADRGSAFIIELPLEGIEKNKKGVMV